MYEVAARMAQGHSLRSLSWMPDMPCLTSLYARVRTRSEFAELTREDRADWYFEQMDEIAATATPGTLAEAKRQIGQLIAQEARLRKRPGFKRRKATAR